MSDQSHFDYIETVRVADTCVTREMVMKDGIDIDGLCDIADDLGVDMKGLNDAEEMQQRLLMHLESQNTQENHIQLTIQMLIDHKIEDGKKRTRLKELLEKLSKTMEGFQRLSASGKDRITGKLTVETLLQTEGITENLSTDTIRKARNIENGQCIVVVAGETNAGKTTFLNLLLGVDDLLTVKAVPCTSVITRISYADQTDIRILYDDGREENVPVDPTEPLGDQIQSILYEKNLDKRENMNPDEASGIPEEVHLKLPNERLKSGLVLVDSPGIGENPTMDKFIQKFVSRNTIDGFLYIIKSDNANRVDEDRVGALIKMILTSQKGKSEKSGESFDPGCALFVCNHWDNVKKTGRDNVYKYIIDKLGKYWPGLTEERVIKFSAKEARRELDINEDYITDEYKALWDGIRRLQTSAQDKRVTSTYKWMETILKRMTHHIKTFVHRLDNSEEGLHEKLQEIEGKMDKLSTKADEVFRSLSKVIQSESNNIFKSFLEHLRKLATKTQITNWTVVETPDPGLFSNWQEIKVEIYQRTSMRISRELATWEDEVGYIREIEREINKKIQTELNLLEEEVEDIDKELDSRSLSSSEGSSSFSYTLGRRSSVTTSTKTLRRRSNVNSVIAGAMFNNQLSVSLVAQVLQPLENVMLDIVSTDKNRYKEYGKNRTRVAREKSERYYKYLLDTARGNEYMKRFIDSLLDQSREKLDDIQKKIPSLINSNKQAVEHIFHCRRDAKVSREVYEQMMTGLEDLKNQLTQYGEGEIFVDDFRNTDIQVVDANDESGRSTIRISKFCESSSSESESPGQTRTLWTVLSNGIINKEAGPKKQVFIRMYMLSSGIADITPEVAKLRFLADMHVAKFLGVHRSKFGYPALIYENRMKTVQLYFDQTKDTKERLRVFQETVKGLAYLHRRSMVHLELNVHTITVNEGGNVKLSGGCLPRKATFPLDKETIRVGQFAYLSPDVLKDETYLTCDDIYSLGLLATELIFKQKPYRQQRSWSLDQFTREVDPVRMLELGALYKDLPTPTQTLLLRCMEKADNRPSIEEFSEFHLEDVKGSIEEESVPKYPGRKFSQELYRR